MSRLSILVVIGLVIGFVTSSKSPRTLTVGESLRVMGGQAGYGYDDCTRALSPRMCQDVGDGGLDGCIPQAGGITCGGDCALYYQCNGTAGVNKCWTPVLGTLNLIDCREDDHVSCGQKFVGAGQCVMKFHFGQGGVMVLDGCKCDIVIDPDGACSDETAGTIDSNCDPSSVAYLMRGGSIVQLGVVGGL
jgi:hypothetical protein